MQKQYTKLSSDTSSNLPNDCGIFTCPAVQAIAGLRGEIAELKNLLTTMASTSNEVMLDNATLMQQYHISRTTAAEWRAKGLEFVKVGRKLIYERAAVDAFLQKHKHRGF